MASFYINTYQPLAFSAEGKQAIARFDYPPFVDYSIRREPDLEHDYPSITCICRGELFAPRIRVGDKVAYLTWKGKYGPGQRHWRATAVLNVVATFSSHANAAEWYRERGLELPTNCMVPGNPPLEMARTAGSCVGRQRGCGRQSLREWDQHYQARVLRNGAFAICEPVFRDLTWSAPQLFDQDWVEGVGVPPTRNPRQDTVEDYRRYMQALRSKLAIAVA